MLLSHEGDFGFHENVIYIGDTVMIYTGTSQNDQTESMQLLLGYVCQQGVFLGNGYILCWVCVGICVCFSIIET